MTPRHGRGRTLLVGLATAIALLVPSSMAIAGNPAGDNGTIKIDGVIFDEAPDNQPHVGCVFQVDFYGFDEGMLNATVLFEAHPPTGRDVLLQKDKIFIGEDDAGGGTDIDAQETYNLSPFLASYMAHPQQGYHVKLTVKAQGSIGADTKYKTFWIQSCPVS